MQRFSDAQLKRALIIVLIAVASLFLIGQIWQIFQFFDGIALIFLAAWIVAFVLSPVANWLQSRLRAPRWVSVTVVYLAVTAVVIGGGILTAPLIGNEVGQLAQSIARVTAPQNVQQMRDNFTAQLQSFGMSRKDAQNLLDQVGGSVQKAAQGSLSGATSNIGGLISSATNLLLDTVIALILSFYMMLDGRRVMDSLIELLPVAWRGEVDGVERHVARVFGGFIRAQILIGISYGVLTWVALAVLGQVNSILIALVSGLIMIIPFFGPYLSLLPPMAVLLLETPDPTVVVRSEILLVVMLFVAQQLVLQVLAPRIMSQGVGLHPIWLFAALLIGAKLVGVWGAFFAPPFAALLAVLLRELHARWSARSPLFSDSPLGPDLPATDLDGHSPADEQSAETATEAGAR
jgi:predicted PurR-regulated permease PerM